MCFEYQGYGHCASRRALTIKRIKEIDQIHLETSEEDEEMEEDATVLASDEGELLVLQRISMPWMVQGRKHKGSIFFTHGLPSRARYMT